MSHSLQIAKTIREQIFTLTPKPILWSWGASAWRIVGENQIDIGDNKKYEGGLLFYVRGHHHKGQVLITLDSMDLYTVTLGHLRKGKLNIKKQFTHVYFDELSEILDSSIERIDAYAY